MYGMCQIKGRSQAIKHKLSFYKVISCHIMNIIWYTTYKKRPERTKSQQYPLYTETQRTKVSWFKC